MEEGACSLSEEGTGSQDAGGGGQWGVGGDEVLLGRQGTEMGLEGGAQVGILQKPGPWGRELSLGQF